MADPNSAAYAPIPDTLGDYLTDEDLATLPYGRDTPLVFGVWPYGAGARFLQLRADERRILVLTAARWNANAGNGPGGIGRVLLTLFRTEMSCPR